MSDRHRLAQINAEINGTEYATDDPILRAFEALPAAMMTDPDLLRAFLDVFMLFRTKPEVLAGADVLDRIRAVDQPPKAEGLGPTRAEHVALVG